jgi:hypothetical protein
LHRHVESKSFFHYWTARRPLMPGGGGGGVCAVHQQQQQLHDDDDEACLLHYTRAAKTIPVFYWEILTQFKCHKRFDASCG